MSWIERGLGHGWTPPPAYGPASAPGRTETTHGHTSLLVGCYSFPSLRGPPFPSFIRFSPSSLHPHPPHAHSLTSRGMMMGSLSRPGLKGYSLRRIHQLPVAKGTGATVAAAPTWKRTSSTQRYCLAAGILSTHCHASRKGLPPRW